ncbi:hypothetical protein MMC06_006338 [Schaereria dolodes]|nr:hypothetical protein [Schaereria dolodes]
MSQVDKSTQTVPSSVSPVMADVPLTLQVGERRFVTTASTLKGESSYFSSLLSSRWGQQAQEDGSYFIDVDGDVFAHVLHYLRHGILPVFYDMAKGHNYALYLAVLGQAKYFQIPRLEKWIKDKTYLSAVETKYTIVPSETSSEATEITSANVDITYHFSWKTNKVYVCPRQIFIHRGNPSACGKACHNAQRDNPYEYAEEEVMRVIAIKKQTVFNQEICMDGEESVC